MPSSDRVLQFEAALDILGSLMARCSADRRGPARRGYVAQFRTLDPDDEAAVVRAIRTYGAELAGLGGTLEVVPRPAPREYRLDPAEHLLIFADDIAPELLDDARPSAAPAALIVAGDPGTGKTTRVRRAARERPGAVVIDPEAFLAYHPRSWDLVLHDDPVAGDHVMTDALGWGALAVQQAITRRADVILEVGTNLPGDAHDYAHVFGEAGYRVEMDLMTAPEAVAKLHLLLRYHCRHGDWGVLPLS